MFSWATGYAIAPAATVTFTFVVRVVPTVQPHKVLANTIYAAWTSLPGRSTALNSAGQIGPDGAVNGMRNGALPNAGDTLNDYEARASASVTVPGLAVTKTDRNPALAPEIGTHKPFQIVINLPEGVTENLSVADNLNAGVVSYVLANNASFDVTYEFVGIDTINGQAPAEAAFTAVPADGATNTATWTIGRVVTTSENDRATTALSPAIRINYFARINNDLVTDANDVLRNSVAVTYRNGETGAPQTVNYVADPITAREPVLTATKELSNVTPGKNPTDPLALGDIVQYLVTITNAGGATAYDVNVTDTLPIELAFSSDYTPTAAINTVPVAGFVAVPAGAPNGPLLWGRGNSDLSLDLPAGAFLELMYRVVVQAPPDMGTGIANRVYTDWTSLQGASVYERTGAGCPTITAPNDYCFGPAVAIGTGTPAPPPQALAKTNTQPTAAVGEVFRYRVRVPSVAYPYALYDVRVTDDLSRVRCRHALHQCDQDLRLAAVDSAEHRHRDQPDHRRSDGRCRHRHPGERTDRDRNRGPAAGHRDQCLGPAVHQHRELSVQPHQQQQREPASGPARHDAADDDRRPGHADGTEERSAADDAGSAGNVRAQCSQHRHGSRLGSHTHRQIAEHGHQRHVRERS